MIRLSDVVATHVEWLWPGRLARGKVTLIDGDPGTGKSALTLDLAARMTAGSHWPDGPRACPGAVVLLTAEDGLADTVRPRLDAAGGDPTRVVCVVGSSDGVLPTIPSDLSIVADAVERTDAALVVVDPLMAYLGAEVNSFRDQDVRRALAPLAALADRARCAVLVVRHLNKAEGARPLYRGGGSIGVIGAVRTAFLVAPDPAEPDRRVMAATKSNLGALPPSLSYRLVNAPNGSPRVDWDLTPSPLTAADLVCGGPASGSELSDATQFLAEVLAGGPLESKEAESLARKTGISERTLRRARKAMGVQARKSGMSGSWYLELPSTSEPSEGGQVVSPAGLAAFGGPASTSLPDDACPECHSRGWLTPAPGGRRCRACQTLISNSPQEAPYQWTTLPL